MTKVRVMLSCVGFLVLVLSGYSKLVADNSLQDSSSESHGQEAHPSASSAEFFLVAGIPYEKAQEILKRHEAELKGVSGVYHVGLGEEGIVIGATVHTQDQTMRPAVLPAELQSLPATVEGLPVKVHPLYILPPPLGVIVLQPGGKREEADSCPALFTEFVRFGWRFCIDPKHPETVPALMVPPIKGIPYEEALEILERHREELQQLPGVESVGMGDGGISIHTANPSVVPVEVEGVPIKTFPPLGPGHGVNHTETSPIRPVHGGIAAQSSNGQFAITGTATSIVLSGGKPWVVFPTHVLLSCTSTNPPCSLGSSLLNTCPHNVQLQGTQLLSQPITSNPAQPGPRIGWVQVWDPDRPNSTSTDVAAAFIDNDSTEGNGSLSADRKQEQWTEIRGSNFSFTGIERQPVANEFVYVVVENLPHVIPALITDVNKTSVPLSLACAPGTFYFSNQMLITSQQTQFRQGDSGGIVLDGAGSVMGMFNWQLNADPRKGGGTQAPTIRSTLHFDAWYGTQTVKDNTIGVFRPSAATWVVDNGNGKFDGPCTSAAPTTTRDQCFGYGAGTDVPITGDWDNAALNSPSNDFTVGVYRPTTDPTYFFLSNTNNPPATAKTMAAGPSLFGYKPVSGKWRGNNGASNLTSKVGVFRPSTGGWYLDSGNSMVEGCGTDYCFFLALGLYQAGDIPIAGDWNGDGIVSIGLFRRGMGTAPDYFYLSNVDPYTVRNNGTISNWNAGTVPSGPGNFGYLPLVGNWTGLTRSGVGVFKSGTGGGTGGGAWYLDNGNLLFPGCTEDQCANFGITGDKPVAFGKSIVKAN